MDDLATATVPESPEKGEVGVVEYADFTSEEAFPCEYGGHLEGFTLRYETYGRLNANRDNAILVCHALSGDHHAAGIHSLEDRKPGWWNNLIGPGKAVDTTHFFVICSNCLGGCQGSSGPSTRNPATGKPYGLDFPLVSIRDMVRAQKRLLDSLGLPRLFGVIGGSMGGMQALQWMIEYPDFVERAIPMACTARQNAQAIAFNEVGRHCIMQDAGWRGGMYPSEGGPDKGLAIARMMAHITYLSDKGMEAKFGRRLKHPDATSGRKLFGVEFEVESYLAYQGQSFVNRFDANTYLYFTKALDRFDLYHGDGQLADAFRDVQARTLVIGFTSDWLFPPAQNRVIAHALLSAGKHASYAEVESDLGHDSFLIDDPRLYNLVSRFLMA